MEAFDTAHQVLHQNKYTWSIDGQKRIPTRSDVQDAVDRMKEALILEPEGSQISVGRLLLTKSEGNFDLYVMAGSI